MPTGRDRSGAVVAVFASLRLGEEKISLTKRVVGEDTDSVHRCEPIKSKDGITQIVKELEEDDHAKSPSRKEV